MMIHIKVNDDDMCFFSVHFSNAPDENLPADIATCIGHFFFSRKPLTDLNKKKWQIQKGKLMMIVPFFWTAFLNGGDVSVSLNLNELLRPSFSFGIKGFF